MSTINDGGPAFPQPGVKYVYWNITTPSEFLPNVSGLSIRDWFAANESIREWDNQDSHPSTVMCEALAGPKPAHGWSTSNPEELIAMLKWEADWRSRIKYIRADSMMKARGE